jgi:hypothetical protein
MTDKANLDGSIVGIYGTTNGRSCEIHDTCGSSIAEDSLIWFKFCYVERYGRIKPAVKAVKIQAGEERCSVGFLPREITLQPEAKDMYHDAFAVIVFLHADSDD